MAMQLHNMLKFKMSWANPSGAHHAVVLSSRVRLARNFQGHLFPSHASPRELLSILETSFDACRKTKALAKGAYVRMDEIEPLERQFLMERHLISHQLCKEPRYRGVVIGEKEILSMMVNEEDHLRIQAIDSGLCMKDLWIKVGALESELSQTPFAFHPEWGYLTACPTNTGTALRASALLHLPGLALSGQINRMLEGLSRAGMLARGLYGEGTRVLGDFYQISNAVSLGKTEEEWIDAIEKGVLNLVARELESQRLMSQSGHRAHLEDLIYRSLGTLGNARSIPFEETMQHLSYARLALSLAWKVPFDLEMINELMVIAQPAHIQMLAGKEIGAADRDFLRATFLRRKFKS